MIPLPGQAYDWHRGESGLEKGACLVRYSNRCSTRLFIVHMQVSASHLSSSNVAAANIEKLRTYASCLCEPYASSSFIAGWPTIAYSPLLRQKRKKSQRFVADLQRVPPTVPCMFVSIAPVHNVPVQYSTSSSPSRIVSRVDFSIYSLPGGVGVETALAATPSQPPRKLRVCINV